MRKRSIPILLFALVAWILAWRMTEAVMLTAVGYKMGGPISATTNLRLIALLALLSSFVGLLWLAVDFLQWIKGRGQ
jgi:hypothetical protein